MLPSKCSLETPLETGALFKLLLYTHIEKYTCKIKESELKVFLVMQRLVENSIRNYSTAGVQFISPRAVFNRKSIASSADRPVGICTVKCLS